MPKYGVQGRITIKGERPILHGDEILYIAVVDSLRHDIDCIELGSVAERLDRGLFLPIHYRCLYDPNRAHMKFAELKTIPGGVTLIAHIERNGQLIYANDTDIPLADICDIQLVKIE